MASLDIGIDLGTSVVIATDSMRSLTLREPAVVAVNTRTGEILSIGADVYKMIGRTPPHIQVVHPIEDGVISDLGMTEAIIRHLLKKLCSNLLIKPQVSICVPSAITNVESRAVINAAVSAGARKVHLIEEPVAAAIGAGIDLSRPVGNLIVDVGGGTTDIAVLSLNGIVRKTSLKIAGNKFDDALVRYVRAKYNILIGQRTAERVKMEIGSVDPEAEELATDVKGRDILSGLPRKAEMRRSETVPALLETAEGIARAVQSVLEKTPPELVGDIRQNGLIMTGGGALLNGLDKLLSMRTKVEARLAENPQECVAIGTAKSFEYVDVLFDGFVTPSMHVH